MPESFKHERNVGSGEQVSNIREGVSVQMLFQRVEQTFDKPVTRMTLLRWALFQFPIGICAAHGKNFSFLVRRERIDPAPWYDLVSMGEYPGIDQQLAMAWGDVFWPDEVGRFKGPIFRSDAGSTGAWSNARPPR